MTAANGYKQWYRGITTGNTSKHCEHITSATPIANDDNQTQPAQGVTHLKAIRIKAYGNRQGNSTPNARSNTAVTVPGAKVMEGSRGRQSNEASADLPSGTTMPFDRLELLCFCAANTVGDCRRRPLALHDDHSGARYIATHIEKALTQRHGDSPGSCSRSSVDRQLPRDCCVP